MKRKHVGSKFDNFLAEEGILEECRASAIKFAIARKLNKTNTPGKYAQRRISASRGDDPHRHGLNI